MSQNTISQRDVRNRRIAGKAGMLAYLSIRRNRIGSFTNADPQRRMTKTVTVDTFTDGATYALTIEGRVVSYVAVTADTNVAGVAASFAAAINADPQARQIVNASAAAAVITLTGNLPGVSFSVSESDAKLTLADVLSALTADPIPFGRVLFYGSASVVSPYPNKLVKLPDASDLTGDSFVMTPAVANTTAYNLGLIDPAGARYTAAYTSDGTATAQEIVEGQKSALDALSITGLTSSEDNAALTLNLPYGWSLDYEAPRYSSVVKTAGAAIGDLFAGISLFTNDEPYNAAYPNSYGPNSVLSALEGNGSIFMDNAEGVSRGDACYVELADGDDKGKLFRTSSATRALLPMMRFESDEGDDLAIVKLD